MMKIGLYIHIPFCQQKCLYCDFPSHANLTHLYQPYVAALCQEISGIGGVLSGDIVDSIYIGGGTPTVLSAKSLGQILQHVHTHFSVAKTAEFSIEANPGTIDKEKLLVLQAGGVNRISFGVQTFSDPLLSSIGRIHSAAQAIESVKMAQQVGFSNINVDLMYGLPGQTIQQLEDSILKAAELNVTHISAYGLKVEDGTPFATLQDEGTLMLPDEDEDDAMYELTTQLLPQKGFRRYEISNFAKNGYKCTHNLKYWQYQPYIGVGAAAHSFFKKERLANQSDVLSYIETIASGQLPIKVREVPEIRIAMAEYVFLALRTVTGLSVENFNQYFSDDFFGQYSHVIKTLIEKKLIIATEKEIYLTPIGMKYGNIVFGAFLPE
ncbi:radical SAM family heme chaperone HemW [Pelosinus sp. sgz500959]|uniref:radical SAM family heme chaperone HemW n=1 Tax=Pelosinus sp. sgz500959 TaxID=3242472 RepID=UPI0036726219